MRLFIRFISRLNFLKGVLSTSCVIYQARKVSVPCQENECTNPGKSMCQASKVNVPSHESGCTNKGNNKITKQFYNLTILQSKLISI